MDGASAIAGIIGLAALMGQSAVKIKKLIRDYNESTARCEDIQKWIDQIQGILVDVERSSIEIQNYGLPDVETGVKDLKESLHQCNAKLNELRTDLTKKSLQKRLKKLKTVLATAEIDRKIKDVDKLLETVSHYCENVFRFGEAKLLFDR